MKKPRQWTTLLCCALLWGCSGVSNMTSEATGSTTDIGGSTSSGGTGSVASTTGTSGTGEAPTSGTSGTGGLSGECDPWKQDCPDGYKCMAYAEEGEPVFTGTKCTPVAENPGTEGDPCKVEGGWWTGVDDCDYGYACWNIDHTTNTGVCVALCTGNPQAYDCPSQDDACVFWAPGFAHICLPTCDPLAQDCPAGQSCRPNWSSDVQEFTCGAEYSGDEGQEFDPCELDGMCDPGFICGPSSAATECEQNGGFCCLSYCDLADPQCNGQGAECLSFYSLAGFEPSPEYANVGICVIPG